VFETGSISGSTAEPPSRRYGSERSKSATRSARRTRASPQAAAAETPSRGRTGVTSVTMSSSRSKMHTTVGRTNMPSQMFRASGLLSGIFSNSRIAS
jgi:hypothetical protein